MKISSITPPPVRIPIDHLLIEVDGELVADVTTVTVGTNGKGIVELANGTEKFGHIELAVDFNVILTHLANLGGEHA